MALLVVFALSFVKQSFGSPIPFSTWRVTIINQQSKAQLNVHCKSGDDDLNAQTLKVGDDYGWKFKENFWGTTRFWCTFDSQNGHLTFDVFWPEGEHSTWLLERCGLGKCIWVAKDDGIYLKNDPVNTYELIHKWK